MQYNEKLELVKNFNTSLSLEVLIKLSKDKNEYIRESVASNPNIPQEVYEDSLTKDASLDEAKYFVEKEKIIETPINKGVFNMGGCSAFAEIFYERFKNEIPSIKLGVVRGKIKLDDYEEYGDTEWEDCHAVVMLNEEYYFDVDGLVKFNPESKVFGFSNDTLKVELIALDDQNYKRDDYFIYSEYDGDTSYPLLEKSIHATFGLINDGGTLKLEEINNYKEKANKFIDENATFFNSEIKKAVQIQNEDSAKLKARKNLEELNSPKNKIESTEEKISNNKNTLEDLFKEKNLDPNSEIGLALLKVYNDTQDELKLELENLKTQVVDIATNDFLER